MANSFLRNDVDHSSGACKQSAMAVKDALDALNGKWKLPIIISLSSGPLRFKELQRTIDGITPKILSKELKDLELNKFINRNVYNTSPVSVSYELTPYSATLDKVLSELREWGLQHRQHIMHNHDNAAVTRQDEVVTN